MAQRSTPESPQWTTHHDIAPRWRTALSTALILALAGASCGDGSEGSAPVPPFVGVMGGSVPGPSGGAAGADATNGAPADNDDGASGTGGTDSAGESSAGGSEGAGDPLSFEATGGAGGQAADDGAPSQPSDPEETPDLGQGGTADAPPDAEDGDGEPPDPTEPTNPCDVLPEPSLLEGWASVAGVGTPTTSGGGSLPPRVVTTLGELQAAAGGNDPTVILVRGVLAPGDVNVGSNKTLVGTCGAEVRGHLELSGSVNVIVRNLTIVGYGEGNCALDPDFDASVGCSSGADAIAVKDDAHHIWIDHCSVRDGTDGNLDITNGANFVTVSWTKFSYTPRRDDVGDDSTGASGHRYSNLVGGTDNPNRFDDANTLDVTWHHNWWADNVVERQPRVRFGNNHLFNNYYNSETTNYCVRAGRESSILLEGNYFDGVDDPHEYNSAADEQTAHVTADGSNVYDQTTSDRVTGGGGTPFTTPPYTYALDAANDVPALVENGAGPR